MQFVFRFLLVLLAVAGLAIADGITPAAVSANGAVTRDRHLSEIRDVMRGGRGGYIDLGFYYLPSVKQVPLLSEYGEHDGFAFNHHFAGYGAGEVAPGRHLGALLWYDRSGWDGEDFFFFPQYNDFSMLRSVVTWGFSFTDTNMDWTLAAGMQHVNVEHVGAFYPHEVDTLLYSWAHLRWNKLSAQANFYRKDWRLFRFSLDLESRSIYKGRKSGPLTYLPNVEAVLYNKDEHSDVDTVRVTWEQNLFQQRLYGEVSFDFPDAGFRRAALKFYPDPSRMIGFEASCFRRHQSKGSDDLLWGGAIDLLFVRLAYNSAYDYEHFFGVKGTFIAEIKFNLGTIDGWLFNRGAARSAPLETNFVKPTEKQLKNETGIFNSEHSGSEKSKTIEATGIRYEKSAGPAEGGK